MIRILFVDDEPNVLNGLRLSLRRKRALWQMEFVESGERALDCLRHAPFDVVVADMRMPLMDGAELLSRVAKFHPQVARIVLSGQMDELSAIRATCVAHRFLRKPCDPDVLETTITKTLELSSLLKSEVIKACIGGLARVPSLPQACLALNRALMNQAVSVEEVVRIIETDTGMASKVLQLVNSSFFGLMRPVASITQAVNYLGLNTIRQLVFVQAIFEEFRGTDLLEFEKKQSLALLCARIARQLVADKSQAESAATAALLHDVGSLVLSTRMFTQHKDNRRLAIERGLPLHMAERENLGTTHAEIGAYLLGLWGLPYDIIEAVAFHHAPWDDVRSLDVGASVRLADTLASTMLLDDAEAALHADPAPPGLLERLGVVDVVAGVMAKTRPSRSKDDGQ